jgi:hypothetical protein|uniref:Mitochondrial resolvase Ydc2 catalytic domain-containing protein n=1 Tax=viral metagenome TaxID=1070528 RepID=A0A6C0JS75_9ZZZZ
MIYISFDIGIKNLALCILENKDNNITIIDWRVITLADKKKDVNGLNLISEILFYELDNIIGCIEELNYDTIDYVIIENQPSNLNGIMKSIQLLIFSYFSLLKHWDKFIGQVLLINASLKLQYHSYKPEPLIKIDPNRTKKEQKRDKYRNNKNDGIEITKYYIKDNEILNNYFIKYKKKDDLADTLLQTVSYIKKHNSNSNIEKVNIADKNLLEL